MADDTQKQEKTLESESLVQTAIDAVHGKVKKQMTAGLESGEDPKDLIQSLLKTVGKKVDKPGTIRGILPALIQSIQGQQFKPFSPQQRDPTSLESLQLLNTITTLSENLEKRNIKQEATAAIEKGTTLPGFTEEETKKIAGGRIAEKKITSADIKQLRKTLSAPIGKQLLGALQNLIPGVQEAEKELRASEKRLKGVEEKFIQQFEGKRIQVISPEGAVGDIPEEELQDALSQGFRRR